MDDIVRDSDTSKGSFYFDPGKCADLAVVKLPATSIDDPYDFLVKEARVGDVAGTMIGGVMVHSRTSALLPAKSQTS